MTVPALAIGEMLVRRHRRGLGIVAAGMVTFVLATAASPELSATVMGFAFVLFALVVCYVVAVFGFGFDTDVAAAGSCYPARMLSLPVRTVELAAWPAVFGAAALVALWLTAAGLVFRPWGLKAPLGWPAAVAATQFVWLLALLWWPFSLPWARLGVALLIGHLPVSVTLYAFNVGMPLAELLLALGLIAPAGCGMIYCGVLRTRLGRFRRWEPLAAGGGEPASVALIDARPFRTADAAQRWFEWRRHGFALPLWMALMLPLFLTPFFLDDHSPPKLLRNVALVLAAPVFFAGMGGTAPGRHNHWVKNAHALSSFVATRPLTTAALVGAILRTAARTTLLAWAITAGLLSAAVLLSGAAGPLAGVVERWFAARPAVDAVASVLLGGFLLLLLTWKRLVENLLVGLTGREWLIGGAILVGLFVAFSGVMVGLWLLVHPEYHQRIGEWLPCGMAVVVGLKLLATGFVVREVRRRRLVTYGTAKRLAGLWFLVVATLSATLIWLVPDSVLVFPSLMMAAVLLTPSARLSATPLALDWNRHR
jgi:hypothetical protein